MITKKDKEDFKRWGDNVKKAWNWLGDTIAVNILREWALPALAFLLGLLFVLVIFECAQPDILEPNGENQIVLEDGFVIQSSKRADSIVYKLYKDGVETSAYTFHSSHANQEEMIEYLMWNYYKNNPKPFEWP